MICHSTTATVCPDMLTDIFANRYSGILLWDTFEEKDQRFLVQAFRIINEQIYKPYASEGKENSTSKVAWKNIHDKISMELGLEELASHMSGYFRDWNGNKVWQSVTYSDHDVCRKFTLANFDGSISADRFMKERISLTEIAFRERHTEISLANSKLPRELAQAKVDEQKGPSYPGSLRVPGSRAAGLKAYNSTLNSVFSASTDELNARLQQAGYKLHFHNGFIQASPDALVQQEIEGPFWNLVADAAWKNVDTDMKEAIDRRDSAGRDPAWYAARALESTIKIISGQKGWTHGGEKGAHSYVDNLRSKKNGEFINEWESKILKEFFTAVRNPFGHGPGDAQMPSLTAQQTDWAIEFCMAWIRNLVLRM
jgi:hypothetical protein